MKRMRVWVCATVVIGVGGVTLGTWWGRSATPPDWPMQGATEESIPETRTLPGPVEEPAAAADLAPTPPAPPLPDVNEIRAACPSLIGEFTAQCEAALERRFVGEWPQRPRPLVPGVTYGEIFALDASTYASVRDALARPECRVPPGRMRAHLGENCAADAMARLALLHFVCDRWTAQDPDGSERLRLESRFEKERWEVEPDNAEWLEWLDQKGYLASRERNELVAYDRAWVYRKCRAMPAEALEWRGLRLDHIADTEYMQDGPPWHVRPHLEAYVASTAPTWLSNPLWEAAARLGSELAFDNLLQVEGQLGREPIAGLFAAMEARNPVFAQTKLSELVDGKSAMLAHAMAAQMLAQLQGLEVEWRAGWQGQGERMWYWTEDGEWVSSWGAARRFEAHERLEATLEAKRIVARIAAQQGWDADGLDWSQVAAPDDRY